MPHIEETDLTWECGFAHVGIHYLNARRNGAGWMWLVGDGEFYLEIASGTAQSEREAQRAAVEALLTHLEKCAAECRAALEESR